MKGKEREKANKPQMNTDEHRLPEGWEWKKLGEVYNFKNGINFTKHQKTGKGILTVDVFNMYGNDLRLNCDNLYRVDKKITKDYELKTGDLLIVRSSVKEEGVAWAKYYEQQNEPVTFCGFIIRGRPIIKTIPRFVTFFLRSEAIRNELIKKATKSTITNINQTNLSQLDIPLPPLAEQERIVAILDEAFAAIDKAKANAEKNMANAKELFDSYLNGIFTNPGEDWEEKRLGEVGKVSMCKRIFKNQTSKSGDIPFYKIGTFGKEANAYIPKELYNEYRNKYSFPKKGDILLSASGTIGRRVKYDGDPAYFQDSNIVWIDNDEKQVLNDYLYHFYSACEWKSTNGATISRLYNDNLRQIAISFPSSREKQRLIIYKIDSLITESRQLESIYQQKIIALEELIKSILKKAFEGEL